MQSHQQWIDTIDSFTNRLYSSWTTQNDNHDDNNDTEHNENYNENCDDGHNKTVTRTTIRIATRSLIDIATELSANWNKGDHCPYCNGMHITRYFQAEQKIEFADDGSKEQIGIHPATDTIGWVCNECEQFIKCSPKVLFLNKTKWSLADHTPLKKCINAHISSKYDIPPEDTKTTDECDDCENNGISIQSIFTQAATVRGGDITYEDEKHVTKHVSSTCRSCGHQQTMNPIGIIPFTL